MLAATPAPPPPAPSPPMSARDLDDWLASIDAMNEADQPGRSHASKATLKAGQAAVDRINARRGKT